MTHQPRKMSEVLKEMSEQLLRNPASVPSATAVQFGLMLANFAWNETVGLGVPREGYRSAWETIEADNPEVWSELESNDVDAMIDELVRYKKKYYPDDDRRILSCGFIDGKCVWIGWLPLLLESTRSGRCGSTVWCDRASERRLLSSCRRLLGFPEMKRQAR